MAEIRKIESIAGRYYWQTFAHLPLSYDSKWRRNVPDHWHLAGPRTSPVDRKRAKRALSPAHAVLNYLYAILESETTIAAYRMGFDPSLGLMHADKRYRPSLSSDLMEPARPVADRFAVELLRDRQLARGDVVETREGICRLGRGARARAQRRIASVPSRSGATCGMAGAAAAQRRGASDATDATPPQTKSRRPPLSVRPLLCMESSGLRRGARYCVGDVGGERLSLEPARADGRVRDDLRQAWVVVPADQDLRSRSGSTMSCVTSGFFVVSSPAPTARRKSMRDSPVFAISSWSVESNFRLFC